MYLHVWAYQPVFKSSHSRFGTLSPTSQCLHDASSADSPGTPDQWQQFIRDTTFCDYQQNKSPPMPVTIPSHLESGRLTRFRDACPSSLNFMHMELFFHWMKFTSCTISRSSEMAIIWRDEVPRNGLTHGYVLQAMLSLSALHLALIEPAKKDYYISSAMTLRTLPSGTWRQSCRTYPKKIVPRSLFSPA